MLVRTPYGWRDLITCEISHVTADIWRVHMSGKHYIQVWTQAELPGHRTRSSEVGGAAQPSPTSAPFRWKANSHRHANKQTARARQSQAHPVPKSDGQWRLTIVGTMKPTCFGLLDFTAGYHQTPSDLASRKLTAFRWNRVATGLKRAGPYFQRTMQNKVLNGLVYEICEIYIDDVLIHDKEFLDNTRRVFERLRVKNVKSQENRTESRRSWIR